MACALRPLVKSFDCYESQKVLIFQPSETHHHLHGARNHDVFEFGVFGANVGADSLA